MAFICLLLLCPKDCTSLNDQHVKFLPQITMEEHKSYEKYVLLEFTFFFSVQILTKIYLLLAQGIWKVFYGLSPHANPIFSIPFKSLTSSCPNFYIKFMHVCSPTCTFILCFEFSEGFLGSGVEKLWERLGRLQCAEDPSCRIPLRLVPHLLLASPAACRCHDGAPLILNLVFCWYAYPTPPDYSFLRTASPPY